MTVHQLRPACPDCGKNHAERDEALVAEQVRETLATQTPAEVRRTADTLEAIAHALRAAL
jgi:predicted  nucleic acid-binding Zn-ribbon protein